MQQKIELRYVVERHTESCGIWEYFGERSARVRCKICTYVCIGYSLIVWMNAQLIAPGEKIRKNSGEKNNWKKENNKLPVISFAMLVSADVWSSLRRTQLLALT